MTPKQKIKVSKYLCFLLRHDATMINESGWAKVDLVLDRLSERYADVSLGILKEIVTEDDKQRYAFGGFFDRIRASQGHSIPVDLNMVAMEPPEFLYHGTAEKTLWSIRRDGLLPMDRQHVHLSIDRQTAVRVGRRHGVPVVIEVRALALFLSGQAFYLSDNDVWLTASVKNDYLNFED